MILVVFYTLSLQEKIVASILKVPPTLRRHQLLLRSFRSKGFRQPFIGAIIVVALYAGNALAGDIYVDGVACQLADAIIAANTDQAIYGCLAGDGADNLILLRNISLQIGTLPSITSDITIVSSGVDIQECACGENNPNNPPEPPALIDPPADTPTSTALPRTATPAALSRTATPTALSETATPTALSDTATPTALSETATPTALSETATPTAPTSSEIEPPNADIIEISSVRSACVHVVARGENLFRIALQYNMTVGRFSSFNNLLSNDTLVEGQELIIPVDACQKYAPSKG